MNQDPSAAVRRMYQAIVGRPPEEEVCQLYADLLETGTSTEQVEQLMGRSPDARTRREALAAFPHHGVVPYTLDEAQDGRVLLVLTPHRPWGFESPEAVDSFPDSIHVLTLGVDHERSDLSSTWRCDATELIGGKAARLGIPLSRTVCFGIGDQGALALSAGLAAGAGWVVASGDVTQVDDEDLTALLTRSTHTTVHLYVATTDPRYPEAFAVQQAAKAAGGSFDIVEADYTTDAELHLGARRHVKRVLEYLARRG
jgi:predicted esterase